jgi:hypothetical protein
MAISTANGPIVPTQTRISVQNANNVPLASFSLHYNHGTRGLGGASLGYLRKILSSCIHCFRPLHLMRLGLISKPPSAVGQGCPLPCLHLWWVEWLHGGSSATCFSVQDLLAHGTLF